MIDPSLAEQLHGLLAEARPGTVPGNVLAWWGPTDFPDGTTSVPTLSQAAWEWLYQLLASGAIARRVLPPLGLLETNVRRARPDGVLPIAVVDAQLAVPASGLADRVIAAARAGTALDRPPRDLAAATTPARAFFAAALLHAQWGRGAPAYRGRDVTYVVDPELWVTNLDRPAPERLEVDAGDGRGFRPVRLGVPFEASYREGATATVTLRVADGRVARLEVALSDEPAAPPPDETWRLGDATNTGVAYVHRAIGRHTVVAPVIVAEGFPGAYAPDYLYDVLNQHGLVTSLRAAGRDVVLLSFDQGTDRIQRNAGVVRACIREAHRRTSEALAVGGVSMGGLVSRYALTELEHRGEPHHTSVFFTVDTPHTGAYTSVGAQWFAQSFRRSSAALEAYATLLDSPANQEFVRSWVHEGSALESPLRREFVRDLARLGDYPRRARRVAVSCGRGDGARSIPPSAPTLSWSGSPFVDAELTTTPQGASTVVGRGYCFADPTAARATLTVTGEWSWEGAPGGQDTYAGAVAQVASALGCGTVEHRFDTSCSVPTVSALGLDQDPFTPIPAAGTARSPFHAYTCSAENQHHLVLEPTVAAWLARELTAPGRGTDHHEATSSAGEHH